MSETRLTIVAVGNAFDGITVFGPFMDAEVANEWADRELRNEEWHTLFLNMVNSKTDVLSES